MPVLIVLLNLSIKSCIIAIAIHIKTNYSSGPQYFGTTAKKSWFDEGDRCSPGPAAHELKRLNKTNLPSWSIGKDDIRDTFLQKHHLATPSPDRYKVVNVNKTHLEEPHFSVPGYEPKENINKIDEGNSLDYRPKYNVPKIKYPEFSFGYHFDKDYTSGVPPPDNYNPSIIDRKAFNKTQRSFSIGERPTPYGQEGRYPPVGRYSIGGEMGGTKYSVGNSTRLDYTIGASPGQFYQISGDIKHIAHGKTMGLLIEVPVNKDLEDFPSPNKYNPQLPASARNIINYRSNRSEIRETALDGNPSPNKYEQKELPNSQTVSFTKQKRQSPQPASNPGVGTYNVQKKFDKTLGNMAIKLKKLTEFVNPAPTAYEPKDILTKPAPQKPINYNSDRIDFSKSVTGGKVGPGKYEVRTKEELSLGKIGKGLKFQPNKNANPGPGSYQISNGIGKLPKYCSGPKKLTTTGFSIIQMEKQERHERLQRERQKKQSFREAYEQVQQKSAEQEQMQKSIKLNE